VELGYGDGDVGVDEDLFEAERDGGFELVGGESGGLELADDGEVDVASAVDGDGLAVDFVYSDGSDQELVSGAENILRRE
jgi:hypothetical protein